MRKKDYETRQNAARTFFRQKGLTKRAAALMLVCTLILTMTPVLADGSAAASGTSSETNTEANSEIDSETGSEIVNDEISGGGTRVIPGVPR
jgi:hypothetical protein